MEPMPKPKPRAGPKWVGVALTAVWVGVVLLYVATNWEHVKGLQANALGDFAAGASAPLAFLWLVIGYFQQGEELRNSANALWLQGEELRASVEQQRKLADYAARQLEIESERIEAERESRPSRGFFG